MIFYFTGTGNSYYAAKKLCQENERMIRMTKDDNTEYVLEKGEKLGFVFPVYFYTVPFFVQDWIRNLKVKNVGYAYAVLTCGGNGHQARNVFANLVREKGFFLNYAKEVVMPDNSMLFYQIPGNKGCEEKLQKADAVLQSYAEDIRNNLTIHISNSTWMSDLLTIMYRKSTSTAKFHAEDSCIHCGKCAANCPEKAIVMENGKPVWKNASCSKCSACIHRCPVQAIQYGKATKKRNRYVNPYYED